MLYRVKLLIKRLLGRSAWIKLTELKQELKYRNISIHMDPKVYELIGGLLPKSGFYLDVGAHDGRASSNTYHLERQGWNGILVEPILTNYFKLFIHRNREQNTFVNAACVSDSFKDKYLEMVYCDLMSYAPTITDIDSASWEALSQDFMNPYEHKTKVYVPVRTLSSILGECNAPEVINFLSIDVEGSELEVLGGIDLKKYSFDVVCIETSNIDIVLSLFSNNSYKKIGYVNGNLILSRQK